MTGMYIALGGVYYPFTYVSPTSGTLGAPYAGNHRLRIGQCLRAELPEPGTAGALTWEVCGYAAR